MRTDTPHFGARTITPPDANFFIFHLICYYFIYLLFISINCGKQNERLQAASVRQLLSSGR